MTDDLWVRTSPGPQKVIQLHEREIERDREKEREGLGDGQSCCRRRRHNRSERGKYSRLNLCHDQL